MTETEKLKLLRPEGGDFFDVDHFNRNMEILESAVVEHKHSADDVNDGVFDEERIPIVSVKKGGTGAKTTAEARANLDITPANIGAAAASHGNHVPAKQTANNATFLRNDNTWQKVTPANIGALAESLVVTSDCNIALLAGGGKMFVNNYSADTLNSPKSEGLVTDGVGLVITYAYTNKYARQFCLCGSAGGVCTRYNQNGTISKWSKLGNDDHTHTAEDITGTIGVGQGGTGQESWYANRLMYPSATDTLGQLAFPSVAGSVLRQDKSGAPYWTSVSDLKTAMGVNGGGVSVVTYMGNATFPRTITLPFSPSFVAISSDKENIDGYSLKTYYGFQGEDFGCTDTASDLYPKMNLSGNKITITAGSKTSGNGYNTVNCTDTRYTIICYQ